jgi:hypothetical protein
MFRECLEDCGLIDLGFTGPKYIWTNKQDADIYVRVCLDRAVGNGAFLAMFDNCNVENVITTTSDHMAISINLCSFVSPAVRPPVQSGTQVSDSRLHGSDLRSMSISCRRLGPITPTAHLICNLLGPLFTQLSLLSRNGAETPSAR